MGTRSRFPRWNHYIIPFFQNSKTPTIFGDQWEVKVEPESIRKFTPTLRYNVPTVTYSVVGEGGDHIDNDIGDGTVRFPEDKDLNYRWVFEPPHDKTNRMACASSDDQEPIQSDPTSCSQNQKGNN